MTTGEYKKSQNYPFVLRTSAGGNYGGFCLNGIGFIGNTSLSDAPYLEKIMEQLQKGAKTPLDYWKGFEEQHHFKLIFGQYRINSSPTILEAYMNLKDRLIKPLEEIKGTHILYLIDAYVQRRGELSQENTPIDAWDFMLTGGMGRFAWDLFTNWLSSFQSGQKVNSIESLIIKEASDGLHRVIGMFDNVTVLHGRVDPVDYEN